MLRVAEKEVLPPEMPLFPLGETTSVDIERRDGSHSRVMVHVPKSKTKERPLIELQAVSFTKLDGDIGWLKVCMFPGAIGIDLARDIDNAVRALDCGRLIIDLRGNTGGGIGCLRLMSYLTPGQVPAGYSLTRKRAANSFRKEDLPVFNRIPSRKLGLLPLLFTGLAPLRADGPGRHRAEVDLRLRRIHHPRARAVRRRDPAPALLPLALHHRRRRCQRGLAHGRCLRLAGYFPRSRGSSPSAGREGRGRRGSGRRVPGGWARSCSIVAPMSAMSLKER